MIVQTFILTYFLYYLNQSIIRLESPISTTRRHGLIISIFLSSFPQFNATELFFKYSILSHIKLLSLDSSILVFGIGLVLSISLFILHIQLFISTSEFLSSNILNEILGSPSNVGYVPCSVYGCQQNISPGFPVSNFG